MTNSSQARTDFVAWSATIPEVDLTRPWGFEIEAPQGWKIPYSDIPSELNATTDGSVHSEISYAPDECECDCEECDHSCDCDNCDIRNGYNELEHCGSAECQPGYNEFSSEGPLRESLPDSLVNLCKLLDGTEQNDSAGVHVHVEAKDLNCLEISRVLRIYANLTPLMTAIAGRTSERMAADMNSEQGKDTIENLYNSGTTRWQDVRMYNYHRYQAVNVTALPKYGTLEFRQMACNFDAKQVASWGRLHRGLISAVKAGLRPFETESVETLADYLRILSRYTIV